jgi:hypothetical protein
MGELGGAGFKAQNNTQTVFTDSDSICRFQTELIAEHLAARDQEAATVSVEKRQRRPTIADLRTIRASEAKAKAPNKASRRSSAHHKHS